MEDVYTIKVKTKPDTRNLYPSERRYSASTVSGLAWVHIALAATSFLLACLALVNPNAKLIENGEKNETDFNDTEFETNSTVTEHNGNYILVIAPTLVTVFALSAGVASIMASIKWYIDHNITWLFVMSILSTLFSLIAFVMVASWFITSDDITEFYKDKEPFKDYFVVKASDILDKNESHLIVKNSDEPDHSKLFTKRVLSINILIASFLELLWSILSVKISYKGMRNNYKDNEDRRANCIAVVTTIKGNNTKNLPRNGKLLPPKPDLIDHYPSRKIKKIFLAQSDSGFYLKNQNNKAKNTESSSEFYKERMMNFLNRCASFEGSNDMRTPSVQSESVLNPIPEVIVVEVTEPENRDRVTPLSWGDSPVHTVYNQNTLNLDAIFKFSPEENDKSDEISENSQNN